MKINRLVIRNFRNFDEETFTLHPHFTVFIGDNGLGKSSVLRALRVAAGTFFEGVPDSRLRHRITESDVRRQFITDDRPLVSDKVWLQISDWSLGERHYKEEGSLLVTYNDNTNSRKRKLEALLSLVADKARILNSIDRSSLTLPVIAYFGANRVFGQTRNTTSTRQQFEYLDAYRSWDDLRKNSFIYQTWLNSLKISGNNQFDLLQYELFVKALHESIPFLNQVSNDGGELSIDYTIDEVNYPMRSLQFCSDGLQAMVSLVAELACRCILLNIQLGKDAINKSEGIVLIDELDMHLHPNWQRHVVSDLQKGFPSLQFVATTHSASIVQSLTKDQLRNLNKTTSGLPLDPANYGIEDVMIHLMDVEKVHRSELFRQKLELSTKYYRLLDVQYNQGTPINDATISELKRQLELIEIELGDDPVLVMMLKEKHKQYEASR